VAFYGPPADGLKHFGKPGWAEVFQAFEAEPDRDWAADFRASPYHAEYVAAGLSGPLPAQARDRSAAPPPPPRTRGRLGQLSTLCRRYMAVIASDRNFLIMLGVLPVVLGALILAMGRTAPQGLAGHDNTGAQSVLLTLVICACLAGATNSVRELVKERPIYERERAAGLSSGAYLWSKLIVLGVITAVQAAVLVLIGLAGLKMPATGSMLKSSPLAEIIVAIALLAVASMTLGLLVSAIVNTSEKTMPFLVLSVMAQVILCGGLLALPVGLAQISYLTPARWGFAATASTVDFNNIIPPGSFKPEWIWNHTSAAWLTDMAGLAVLALLFLALAWWRLVQLGPGRKRR
jgi:ABC-type multidrug transport system permease subunit